MATIIPSDIAEFKTESGDRILFIRIVIHIFNHIKCWRRQKAGACVISGQQC